MTNAEIKRLARIEDVTYWEIANVLGFHKTTIVNWLASENLPQYKKEELVRAIKVAAARKEQYEI